LDDAERSIDDAMNVCRCLWRDACFAGVSGAVKINLAVILVEAADREPGLDQYSCKNTLTRSQSFHALLL
jgi:hypothetical protein